MIANSDRTITNSKEVPDSGERLTASIRSSKRAFAAKYSKLPYL
jgi:hypothetical protein